ncbi:hypothetical protein MRX96_015564 [Rhipicephalus microplus]
MIEILECCDDLDQECRLSDTTPETGEVWRNSPSGPCAAGCRRSRQLRQTRVAFPRVRNGVINFKNGDSREPWIRKGRAERIHALGLPIKPETSLSEKIKRTCRHDGSFKRTSR